MVDSRLAAGIAITTLLLAAAGITGAGPFSFLQPVDDKPSNLIKFNGETCTSKTDCRQLLVPNALSESEFDNFWQPEQITCDPNCRVLPPETNDSQLVD